MTELYLADALQEISPELVMEAMLPLKKRKRFHFLAFAACFALVTVCSFTVSRMGMGGAGSDAAAPESEGAVMEGIEDSGSVNESAGDGAESGYVVYDSSGWELVNFDLFEMYDHAETVVIGRYTGDFDVLNEDSVTVHLYEFTVEQTVKGSTVDTITVRLPVLREISGTVEGEDYHFITTVTSFFDPTEDGQVMLFLQNCGSGVYRKAQEPFTVAIGADGRTELRSNLLLPYEERVALSNTSVTLENGRTLIYTDDTLLNYNGTGFSGLHINELLEMLGSELQMGE